MPKIKTEFQLSAGGVVLREGDSVEITYWRGDQEHEARVRLDEDPEKKNRAHLGIGSFMRFFEEPKD